MMESMDSLGLSFFRVEMALTAKFHQCFIKFQA